MFPKIENVHQEIVFSIKKCGKGSLNYVVLLNHKEVVYCKYLISKVCNCNIFKLRYLKPIYIWTCGANYWAEYPGHRGSTLEERDLGGHRYFA